MNRMKFICLTVVLAVLFSMLSVTSYAADGNKMVAHYKFDGDCKDSSGNGLDGQITGEVPFEEGILGKSAQFGNGYIEVKDNDLLDFDKAFTASMWVKMSPKVDKKNWSNFRALLLKYGKRYSPYTIYLDDSKTGLAEFDGNDYNTSRIGANKSMELIGEKWYLYTVTFDQGNVSIYYDDKLIKSGTVRDEDKALKKTDGSLVIGQDAKGQWSREFYGLIDDLRLYNYALGVDEIKGLYSEVMKSAAGVISVQIENPKMTVNNVEKEIDPGKGTAPIVVNNRTLVPIRAIVEAMGGTIGWDGNENRVDISLKGKTIKLWIDKLESQVGDEKKALDVAPTIIKDRTMLPLRFVAENLGAIIEWNETERKAIIRYNP